MDIDQWLAISSIVLVLLCGGGCVITACRYSYQEPAAPYEDLLADSLPTHK